jgi:hypothetical protein
MILTTNAKWFMQEYKDVFAWSYHDLRAFLHIYWIEFDTSILPIHQAKNQMKPKYGIVMK